MKLADCACENSNARPSAFVSYIQNLHFTVLLWICNVVFISLNYTACLKVKYRETRYVASVASYPQGEKPNSFIQLSKTEVS